MNTCGLRLRSAGTLTILSAQPVAPWAVVHVDAPNLIQLLAGPVNLEIQFVPQADITFKSMNSDRTGVRCSDSGVGNPADVTITKTGNGIVELNSDGFSGSVFVQQGTLELHNPGTLSPYFTGPLRVGDGSGGANADVLRILSSNIAATDTLIVAESGFVDVNTAYNNFGHIQMTGGQIRSYLSMVVFQNYPYIAAGTIETIGATTTATIGGDLIPLNGDLVLQVADGAADPDLDLAGILGGAKPLIKNGPGQLRFSMVDGGPGRYNSLGRVVINEGTLELAGNFVSTAKTDIQVGDGAGGAQVDVLTLAAGYQMNTTTDTLLVTSSGLVQMNGFTDRVGQVVLDGSTIDGGGGRLGVYAGVTSVASSVTATITGGALDLLGGEAVFMVPDGPNVFDLDLAVAVGSPNPGASLRKTGAGRLTLSKGSSLTGSTIVAAGELAYFSTTANNHFSGSSLRLAPGTAFFGFAADISCDTLAVPAGVTTSFAHSDLHLAVIEGDLNTSSSSLSTLVSPGVLAVSGALTLGTDTLSVNLAGTLPGTTYDQIRAGSSIALSGTLRVGLLNGFFPSISDTFVILQAPSVTGSFSGIDMSALGGPQLAIAYLPDSVILYGVAGSPVAQPDPL